MSKNPFTAPLEVDRELYCLIGNGKMKGKTFPTPREVDRYLYSNITTIKAPEADGFPAPREVDRYLYPISCI